MHFQFVKKQMFDYQHLAAFLHLLSFDLMLY